MSKTTKAMVAAAAVAGIFTGSIAMAKAATTGAQANVGKLALDKGTSQLATNSCKGQNDCKGKGGCKSGDNGCKGKNTCKGKGGCASSSSKKSS